MTRTKTNENTFKWTTDERTAFLSTEIPPKFCHLPLLQSSAPGEEAPNACKIMNFGAILDAGQEPESKKDLNYSPRHSGFQRKVIN